MQIDLQEPLRITRVEENGKSLKYSREGNVYLEENTNKELTLMLQSSDCEFCN